MRLVDTEGLSVDMVRPKVAWTAPTDRTRSDTPVLSSLFSILSFFASPACPVLSCLHTFRWIQQQR